MGHQFARASAAASVTLSVLVTACGGGDRTPPDPLEVARSLAAQSTTPVDEARSGSSVDGEAELAAPDPSTFEGETRVVNLWPGADGTGQEVDVWGRRTFSNGPILLAEGLSLGEISEPFGVPPGYAVEIVGAGAGPDGLALAGVLAASRGERVITVFTNADDRGTAESFTISEVDPSGTLGAPAAPAGGSGLLVLRQANTDAFADDLEAAGSSDSFYIGDGSGECLRQRTEDTGVAPAVLGGTQSIEIEFTTSTAAIDLYSWRMPDRCATPPVASFVVDVPVGSAVLGLVFSRDGHSLELMPIPLSLA